MALLLEGLQDGTAEFGGVVGKIIGEIAIFGVAPLSLHGVQFRSVRRQPFNGDVAALFLELACRTAMCGQAIHDDDQWPTCFLTELQEKTPHVLGADVLGMHLKRRLDTPALRRY